MSASLTGDPLALRLLYAAWSVAESDDLSDALAEVVSDYAPEYWSREDLHREATTDDVAAWLTTGSVEGM